MNGKTSIQHSSPIHSIPILALDANVRNDKADQMACFSPVKFDQTGQSNGNNYTAYKMKY